MILLGNRNVLRAARRRVSLRRNERTTLPSAYSNSLSLARVFERLRNRFQHLLSQLSCQFPQEPEKFFKSMIFLWKRRAYPHRQNLRSGRYHPIWGKAPCATPQRARRDTAHLRQEAAGRGQGCAESPQGRHQRATNGDARTRARGRVSNARQSRRRRVRRRQCTRHRILSAIDSVISTSRNGASQPASAAGAPGTTITSGRPSSTRSIPPPAGR